MDQFRGRVVDFAIEGLAPDLDDFEGRIPMTSRESRASENSEMRAGTGQVRINRNGCPNTAKP